MQSSEVLKQFCNALPRRPYCTNDLKMGICPCLMPGAATHRYIQPNRAGTLHFLPFDIDYDYARFAANDANLPPPSIIILNPDNGRGHLLYGLSAPVTINANNMRPARYAAAIQSAFTVRLNADPGYTGLLTKNPLCGYWRVVEGDNVYTLDELADWIPDAELRRASPKRREIEPGSLGRNCQLFDAVRHWAYRARRQYNDRAAWDAAVYQQAVTYNTTFSSPLPDNETRHTARSIAKWVWSRFSAEEFSEIQAARGKRGGKKGAPAAAAVKRQATEERIIAAVAYLRMKEERVTAAAVSRLAGISKSAISQHYKPLLKKLT